MLCFCPFISGLNLMWCWSWSYTWIRVRHLNVQFYARSSNKSIIFTWCFMIKGGVLNCLTDSFEASMEMEIIVFFCGSCVFFPVFPSGELSPYLFFNFLQAKEIAAIQRSEAPMSKMPRQRGRWSQPTSNIEMTVKSMLDLRQLESFSVSRSPSRDSLSQNSNGDEREEQADLPVHINKVRAVLLWRGESTLSASVLPLFIITYIYYYLMPFCIWIYIFYIWILYMNI